MSLFPPPALLQDMEGLRGQLEGELDSISLKRVMVQIQDKLISTQEIGDDKLQIVQHILDIIENRQRQLELDCKNLGGWQKTIIDRWMRRLIIFKSHTNKLQSSASSVCIGCGTMNMFSFLSDFYFYFSM